MNGLRAVAAWIAMLRLLLDPPALFHRLHGLAWYRAALWATLPAFKTGLAGQSVLGVGCAGGDFCADMGVVVHCRKSRNCYFYDNERPTEPCGEHNDKRCP